MLRARLQGIGLWGWVSAGLLLSALGCHSKNVGGRPRDPAGAPPSTAVAGSAPAPRPAGPPVRWAISSNDNKNILSNGTVVVAPNARPDTVSIIDLNTSPPRLIFELNVPGSVIGPPLSMAVTPDESLALVSSPLNVNPDAPTKPIPHHRI